LEFLLVLACAAFVTDACFIASLRALERNAVQGAMTINATRAKNAFGEIMESVRKSVPVFIEKHGKAEAVVLNVNLYRTLVRLARTPDEVHLDGLREDFETLYSSMQDDKSR